MKKILKNKLRKLDNSAKIFSVEEKSVPDETEQGKTQIAFTC